MVRVFSVVLEIVTVIAMIDAEQVYQNKRFKQYVRINLHLKWWFPSVSYADNTHWCLQPLNGAGERIRGKSGRLLCVAQQRSHQQRKIQSPRRNLLSMVLNSMM